MNLKEINFCDSVSRVVEWYRNTHHFTQSPCWMDEWALGYFCALRDTGIINHEQWKLLCSAFQPEDLG